MALKAKTGRDVQHNECSSQILEKDSRKAFSVLDALPLKKKKILHFMHRKRYMKKVMDTPQDLIMIFIFYRQILLMNLTNNMMRCKIYYIYMLYIVGHQYTQQKNRHTTQRKHRKDM